MKKILYFALAGLLLSVSACKKETDPNPIDQGGDLVELTGNLTTQSLDASKKYLIKGQAFVQAGQVLTIPAGTVIYGERKSKATLIINEGGKIEAKGTAESPIIFTSNQAVGERDRGDWGGIIIVGKANVNQNRPGIEGVSPEVKFGTQNSTNNDGESSGTLQYVRIEFAGIELTPNNETNSLTMGGVGNGTTIDHVQASFGGDDSFEWFGGTVDCKNLVSYSTWDDDFDVDFGYTGKVQFGLALRNPSYADQSGSNGFEVDNDANASASLPLTSAVFSNMTVLGPRLNTGTSISGSYQHAMHIRRNAAVSILNSVFTGFPIGLRLDGSNTQANYYTGGALLANNIIVAVGSKADAATPFAATKAEDPAPVEAYWMVNGNTVVRNTPPASSTEPATKPDYAASNIKEDWFFNKYPLGEYPADPDFTIVSQVNPDFSNAKVSGPFFEKVDFIGAFGTTDWTNGWSNFDPIDVDYKK